MIKAYFFDWMGTLGYVKPDNTEEIKRRVTKEQHDLLLTRRLEEIYIDNKELVQSSLINVTLPLYPDSERVISKLRLNYKLAIISNMYDITVRRIRKLFIEFLDKFDVLTFSPEIGLTKPDSRIFTYTLERLNKIYGSNISSQEVVMIGDSMKRDIIPARSLKMQVRLIDRTKENLEAII